MILLAGLYLDPDADRMREFLTCIERNAANRAIADVHVFVNTLARLDHDRLTACLPGEAAT